MAAESLQASSKAAPEPRAIRVRLSFDLASYAAIRARDNARVRRTVRPGVDALPAALDSANPPTIVVSSTSTPPAAIGTLM